MKTERWAVGDMVKKLDDSGEPTGRIGHVIAINPRPLDPPEYQVKWAGLPGKEWWRQYELSRVSGG